jgi:shikimate kinase/3-dehydroquinate synthase
MKSIVLTGFMGVGKTTIGKKVAKALRLPFVDLDRRIEQSAGKSIAALFEEGEAHFRHWEQRVLATIDLDPPIVLATGGGTLMSAHNRALVANATIILLTAPFGLLAARVGQSQSRPLAPHLPALYERRLAIYQRLPIRVDTSHRSLEEIIALVVAAHRADAATPPPLSSPIAALPLSVSVGRGLLRTLGAQVATLNPTGAAIITDTTLAKLWGEQIRHDLLASGIPVTLLKVPPGESHKTLATVATLYDQLAEAGLDRSGVVVALGGGVVGDMAGFVAATWMRGMRGLVQIPTTLLAMVDASIGGKTGVDHPKGKNLIGAFRQPDLILADPDLFSTLPPREWRSGLAEVIKHGVIADPDLFAWLRQSPPRDPPTANEPLTDFLETWLPRAIRVKAEIVSRDPFEQGERAKLNLGHTFGHAYETLSHYTLAHGEAVALGMVTAARLSEQLGLAEAGVAAEIAAVLASVGLPTVWREAPDGETIWNAMQHDKKKAGKGLRLVLPRAIGDVMVTAPGEISKQPVLSVLAAHHTPL